MAESYKSDRSPINRRQDDFSQQFAARLWRALGGRKLKWLAEQSGISTSMLSDYGKGGRVPGADKAVAIAKALQVDVGWLLDGSGEAELMLASGEQRPRIARRNSTENPDVVEIDQIDLRYGLGATYREGHVEVSKRTFDREWLRSITNAPPSKLVWAAGEGDSMEPTIRSGEVVLIDTSADKRRFDDTIWAVMLGEVGMIKRLRSRGDTVELLSDNPLVPPQTAADDEMHAVGRVIAVVRRL
jgi:phage repressor protein C with HTH and peptisase S24 domain